MTKCRDCSVLLVNNFYPQYSKTLCKDCTKLRWRKINNSPHKVIYRNKWQMSNPDYLIKKKLWMREYYPKWYAKNGRNRADNYQEAILRWREEHPEAEQARYLVARAIQKGELLRPKNCSFCFREAKIHAHHEDYSKPLEIIWLCHSCHKRKHTYHSL